MSTTELGDCAIYFEPNVVLGGVALLGVPPETMQTPPGSTPHGTDII